MSRPTRLLFILSLGLIHAQALSNSIECHLADNYCIECVSGIFLSCGGVQGFVKNSEKAEFMQFGVEYTDAEAGTQKMAMQLDRPPGRLGDYLPHNINQDPFLREQIKERHPGIGDDFVLYIVDHTALAKQLILKNTVRMYRDQQGKEFKSYVDGTVPEKLCDYGRSDVRPAGTLSDGALYCREQVSCVSTLDARNTVEMRVCLAESADRCPPVEGCNSSADPRFAGIAAAEVAVETAGADDAGSIQAEPGAGPGGIVTERVTPLKRGVNVRSGPDVGKAVVFVAEFGKPMRVLGKSQTWLEVQSDDGQRGWIAAWLTKPYAAATK